MCTLSRERFVNLLFQQGGVRGGQTLLALSRRDLRPYLLVRSRHLFAGRLIMLYVFLHFLCNIAQSYAQLYPPVDRQSKSL